MLLDAEGTVLFANQTAARRLGRSAAEVVGCTVYDLLPPERTALRSKHFHEVVRTGKPVRYDDERLGRHYEGVVHPVLDEQGKVAALAVFSIDRTERKLAEERLQRAHDELERRVAERTSELSQANQQLRSEIAERRQAEEAFRREHQILKHMLQASDHERQVIAYEIHDGLAQHLAGAIMQFNVHRHLKQTKPDEAEKACDAGMTMLRQGYSEARRLIAGVRPPILDEEGIVAAIAHLANEHRRKNGPAVEYLSDVEFQRLPPILENAVYRIAQEALANACAQPQPESQGPVGAVRPAAADRDSRLGRRLPAGQRRRKPFRTGGNSRAGETPRRRSQRREQAGRGDPGRCGIADCAGRKKRREWPIEDPTQPFSARVFGTIAACCIMTM